MFGRVETGTSVDELRERIARLGNAESDIQRRMDSPGKRIRPAMVDDDDRVQERLFWVLTRLKAQRRAAADRLALISSKDARPTR